MLFRRCIYHIPRQSGNEYWERLWAERDIHQLIEIGKKKAWWPVLCELLESLREKELILEAGCGLGQFVHLLVTRLYARTLAASLKARPVVLAVMILIGGLCVVLFSGLNSELAPVEDRGTVMGFAIAPEGATLDYLNSYTLRMDEIYDETPEVVTYMMIMVFTVRKNFFSY